MLTALTMPKTNKKAPKSEENAGFSIKKLVFLFRNSTRTYFGAKFRTQHPAPKNLKVHYPGSLHLHARIRST